MEYRPQEIKAGIMVVVSIVLLIIFLIAISGMDLFKSTKQYFARFHYTNGLEVGSLVRFGGMEVRQIKSMSICDEDNSLIEFILEVDSEVPIKTNSRATVTSIGIMGEFHVNITTGHPDSGLVSPGSLLLCEDIPPLMQLMKPVSKIADQINETLTEVKKILGTENQNEIHSILVNLNGLLSENQKSIATMIKNLNEVIADFNRMGSKIDHMLVSNEENISNSVKHLEETLIQMKSLMNNMDKMTVDLDNVVLTRGSNFNEIMENLNRTSSNLEEFSRAIKERPWRLLRKSSPKPRKIE